jgi:hypothetical protein
MEAQLSVNGGQHRGRELHLPACPAALVPAPAD